MKTANKTYVLLIAAFSLIAIDAGNSRAFAEQHCCKILSHPQGQNSHNILLANILASDRVPLPSRGQPDSTGSGASR
ncbi:MAG: hypothetical protein J7647_05185 [Cyanobacteria bacterium SBLK]|nr:hypothetical protein [Cyanobacteria bacterium SBLK]